MKFSRTLGVSVAVFALVAAACTSGTGSNPIFQPREPGQQSEPTSLPGEGTGTENEQGAGPGLGDLDQVVPESRPLALREGLGTFNNYEWHMEVSTIGPTAAESLEMTTDWSFNRDPESNLSRTNSTQTGPDFETPEITTQEVYAVEGDTCQYDGESWTFTEATDQQREVLDVAERLFDFSLVPDNPVEVGQETIAGIPATHFTYSVSGFGSESGALVTANQMDYWVSNDTNVLLKYLSTVESRSGPTTDPDAEVYRIEASAELISVNQFVPIDLPAECLATADTDS